MGFVSSLRLGNIFFLLLLVTHRKTSPHTIVSLSILGFYVVSYRSPEKLNHPLVSTVLNYGKTVYFSRSQRDTKK